MKRTKEINPYVTRYRNESRIISRRAPSGLEDMPNLNDPQDLRSYILQREGNTSGQHQGKYFVGGAFQDAKIPALKARLKELEDRFKLYIKSEINAGNQKPDQWPSNLEEERQQVMAELIVAEEELKILQDRLDNLPESQEAESKPLPRRLWGNCELDGDGILHKIGGWHCEIPENADVLHLMEGPYSGMPVWEFKAKILKAISLEENFRERQATKEALETGQRKVKPKPPASPVYHPDTQVIEYPGFSNQVLKRLKLD